MDETQTICDEIQRALPNVKRGTLRFWGFWFGRPYDNLHTLVACEQGQDLLRLRFARDEQLTVWFPRGLQLDRSVFRINFAERVLWEFYYGRVKTEANRFFYDFARTGETVAATSNVNWFVPDMKTDLSLPAIEILSLEFKKINAPS